MEANKCVSLLSHFRIPEREYQSKPCHSGFIHSSFVISSNRKPCYLLQKFNTSVFREPRAVYSNFQALSRSLDHPDYTHYNWIPTREGRSFYKDERGELWRLLSYIPDSKEYKQIQSTLQARHCGFLLGHFHTLSADADPAEFTETIPKFHQLAWHWQQLEKAIEKGKPERVNSILSLRKDIDTWHGYLSNKPENLPSRICHNDTKLSNILFHKTRGEALCFVDLDTVMPGYFYYDFGDLARTVIAAQSEDPDRIYDADIHFGYLKALLEGMASSRLVMDQSEVQSLVYGMVYMPFLHGIRAIADYVQGDAYYKVDHPEQNRYRATNLLAFSKKVFVQKDRIQSIIREIWPA